MARRIFEMNFQIGGRLDGSFSSAFSGVNSRLEQTQRTLRQLHIDYRNGRIPIEQYRESTESLTRQLTRLQAVQRSVKGLQSSLSSGLATAKSAAGMATLGAAAATTGLALDSLNKAGSFEQQMTKVGVVSGSTAAEMKKLNETALELGATTSLSASETALGMTELAAKGMNATTIMSAMPGIIAAAESSGEDLAMTSNVVASALNAFNLSGDKASQVADIMAMAANKTAAGVEDLGYSFKYAAPWANSLGISMEELSAATGVMVDKGLAGEQAGTALRMGLNRLSQEPKKAKKALDKLGVSAFDADGNFTSLNQLVNDLRDSLKGLTQDEKISNIGAIFGTEAASGWLTLIDAAPDRLESLTKALEESEGTAKKAAAAMKDNYAGALEQLSGSIETAQIKFMTPVLPVFQDLFTGLGSSLDENIGGIEKAGEKFAGVLQDIFDPFATQKPVFNPGIKDPAYIEEYNKELAKFNQFSGMDFGDKVVYALDEASAKTEEWLSGSGGDSMNKIFTKLGEIAAKAWWNAFTGAVKSSASNFAEGNVASGVGMGAAAWMLGGGLMVKGAVGAGKLVKGLVAGRGATTAGAAAANTTATTAASTTAASQTAASTAATARSATSAATPAAISSTQTATGSRTAARAASQTTTTASRIGSMGSKALKVAGKAAFPVAAGLTVVDVVRSDDKPKAIAEGVGGLAAGAGGAKLGAAIGTVIAPGIGTAIGGALGGLAGFIGGKFLGGKTVDAARQTANPAPQQTTATQNIAVNQASMDALNIAITNSAHNFKVLYGYIGQASGWMAPSFLNIQSSADKVKHNLDLLAGYTGEASGWMASLYSIQSASQRVEKALDDLAAKINNVQVPSSVGGSKRVSYNG